VSFFVRYFVAPPSSTRLELLERAVRGKTVLITGASFGIGEATALLLARAGAEMQLANFNAINCEPSSPPNLLT
jgi:NADPH:quinone reductase-like Zn-dependent oxidoreductase